jgi:serine/threonine protein kinase
MAHADESRRPTQIGRYQIKQPLGSGGMGVVYAAYDPELDRDVAVKLLPPDEKHREVEAASERLRREAQITAKLAHPNVVTIYDVGSHDGAVYIAMELVDGPSLQVWMGQVARPWRETMRMFFGAGLGLAAAHDAGLIHRDFKPANVLVGDHRARVVDFGLARFGALSGIARVADDAEVESTAPSQSMLKKIRDVSMTSPNTEVTLQPGESGSSKVPDDTLVTGRVSDILATGGRADESIVGVTQHGVGATMGDSISANEVFVGTPAYMAPELFTGAGADARTDQFAYCVALYEGLYGERPFAGETASQIAENVLAHNLREAPERTRVPAWVRAIVVRGLAVDPDERHPNLRSLLASVAFTARIMSFD